MKEFEAIKYLDKLKMGTFLTINIPITRNETMPITAMFVGKDKDGRYEFLDTGEMILSKSHLERGQISIDKEFDQENAMKINKRIRKEYEKAQHKKNKEVR